MSQTLFLIDDNLNYIRIIRNNHIKGFYFMTRLLFTVMILVFITISVYGQSSSKSTELWNGKDFTGWELVTDSAADIKSVCKIEPDSVLAVAGKPIGYLATIGSYENYKLHVEYRWPIDAAKNSNSGVLIHIASGPIDRNTWPLCFQIPTKIACVGDLLPMAGAKFAEPLSTVPEAKTPLLERQKSDSEKPIGQWNIVDIICRDSTIECMINGIVQNRVTKCEPPAGKIGIQLEGAPYELRNIWLTLLD
jgi:hypothetical protein